jgi:hypothetical protein
MSRSILSWIQVLLLTVAAPVALAQDAAQPPKAAEGADAAAAKRFIEGAWFVTLLPPEGSEDKPQTITIVFARDGGLTIAFADEGEPEKGAWLVTAAKAGGGDYLLDEGALDADPEDDIFLDIAFNGDDKAAGVLHDSAENETLRVTMARTEGGANGKPEAAGSTGGEPLNLTAEIPPGIADAVESVKTAGAPADAVLTAVAVDLDLDGVDEALVKVTQMTWCSGNMENCRILILKRSSAGKWESLGYPYAKVVALLPGSTNGLRDLAFDGIPYVKGEFGGYDRKQ